MHLLMFITIWWNIGYKLKSMISIFTLIFILSNTQIRSIICINILIIVNVKVQLFI